MRDDNQQADQSGHLQAWQRMLRMGGRNETAIQGLIYAHTQPYDPVIFTDGSVLQGKKGGWDFIVYRQGRLVAAQKAGACFTMTLSMQMENEAMTKTLS